MAEQDDQPKGPDLSKGVALTAFPENGMLTGQVDGEEVLLVRRDGEVFAIAFGRRPAGGGHLLEDRTLLSHLYT